MFGKDQHLHTIRIRVRNMVFTLRQLTTIFKLYLAGQLVKETRVIRENHRSDILSENCTKYLCSVRCSCKEQVVHCSRCKRKKTHVKFFNQVVNVLMLYECINRCATQPSQISWIQFVIILFVTQFFKTFWSRSNCYFRRTWSSTYIVLCLLPVIILGVLI